MFKKEPVVWMLIAAIFFVPFIGNVHLFDWDEINFAEIAREMLLSGNYMEPQINFQPFMEKPPLFFWLQSICMNIFGVNEFAARLPNALLGIFQLPLLYLLGKRLKGAFFGRLWALIYLGSILPHLYFKSGIIDPWFNFFIFSAVCLVFFSTERSKAERGGHISAFAGGLFAGLAVLTKGPVALLIIGITFVIYIFWKKKRLIDFFVPLLWIICGILISCGSWLLADYIQHGPVFIKSFTQRQWELLTTKDAGHGGFLFYHVVVLLLGCFPASIFMLKGLLWKSRLEEDVDNFSDAMKVLFWVVLVLFSFVQTKIVHYSSLCYFPLTYLAAQSVEEYISQNWKLESWAKVLLGVTGFPFVAAPILMCWLGFHTDYLKALLKSDPFAAENLNAAIHWTGWEFLPGLMLFCLLVYFFIAQFRGSFRLSFMMLFAGVAVYIQFALICFIGRIEHISQHANIEFWQSKAVEDCFLLPYGYKTYTPYFYGQVRPATAYSNPDSLLLANNLSKDLYLSCKVNKKKELEERFPDAQFLYHRNGFYFYRRPARIE